MARALARFGSVTFLYGANLAGEWRCDYRALARRLASVSLTDCLILVRVRICHRKIGSHGARRRWARCIASTSSGGSAGSAAKERAIPKGEPAAIAIDREAGS